MLQRFFSFAFFKSAGENIPTIVSINITVFIGLIAVAWWLGHDPYAELKLRVPGMDGQPDRVEQIITENVNIGEYWESFDGVPANMAGEWPQFRGRQSDNISTENIKFRDQWNLKSPDILWSIDLGEGHAGPAVKNGRVYLLDYDEEKQSDALRCFSLADGKEIWRRSYHVKVKRNHGMSRTIPAVTDQYVVTIGPRCHVMCVSAVNGDFLWGLDLEKDFGTETPFWYTGQCPIIDDTVAVIAPAGEIMMMGVHCRTGDVVWKTPNPNGWGMSHVSIMPMVLNGRRMFVYSAIGGIVAVSAETENRGEILWETPLWTHSVLAPSPVILDDGRIFLTAGYGAGSMMLKVSESEGEYTIEKLQEYKPKTGMASEQQTALYYKGHLFAIQPKDAGELREQFVCYNPDDCTRLIWSSGETNRFGLGPYMIADNKIFILNDDGLLTIIEASTRKYNKLAQFQVLQGHDAWAPLALAGGRMLLRDSKRMVCIDLSESDLLT